MTYCTDVGVLMVFIDVAAHDAVDDDVDNEDVDDVFIFEVVNIFDRLLTKYCCWSSGKVKVSWQKKNQIVSSKLKFKIN